MLHIKEQENGINAQNDTELLDTAYFDPRSTFQTVIGFSALHI